MLSESSIANTSKVNYKLVSIVTAFLLIVACSSEKMPGGGGLPASLKEVPSVRLNFRYEPDTPAPETTEKTGSEERNAAVQTDFDQNRLEELVDRTIASPDGKRVAVVYHRPLDLPNEFRLDMYTPEGKVLKKVTSDLMAVHFPDTIRWSPDSTSLAFLAMLRGASADGRATWGANVRRAAAVPRRVRRGGELGAGDRQPWCGGWQRAPGSEHPGY